LWSLCRMHLLILRVSHDGSEKDLQNKHLDEFCDWYLGYVSVML
jgi:hypothetical protein